MDTKTLTAAEMRLAATRPLNSELVHCPELGGAIRVRGMSSEHRGLLEQEQAEIEDAGKAKGRKNEELVTFRPRVLWRTICDDDGALLYTQEDVAFLATLDASAADRLCDVAMRLSGLGSQAKKEALGN